MRRRALVVGGAAALGIAAGVATALRRSPPAAPADAGTGADAGAIDIWSLTFARVDGVALPMASLRGKPLLVNFWATWCVPCATEMPLLDAFARKSASVGWNVLALAVDSADPVRRFLTERGLSLPVVLAGADGIDLSRTLGNTVGALPFSATFAASGAMLEHKLGILDAALLERWTRGVR